MKRGFQIAFFILFLVVAAGLAAPKFRANEYRGRIQNAMEKGLQRHVTLGEVRYNLLTGPGFTVSDVSIGEDPALGAEPIAYVVKLEAIPRLWSLFTGHLEFSSLRLEDAQLNLSRNEGLQARQEPGHYRWNVESLLQPSIVATFPTIRIRGGRINFEVDHVKSVVYLLDSDLDITPPSGSRETWKVQFEGKPARTDRPARGSGSFTARGEWKPSNGTLDLNLQLDRSEISDLVALIHGADIGVHGTVSGKAHLAGPASALAINGRLNVAELHGWDQSVPQGEVWPLDLSGLWNVGAQQLKLDANVAGKVTAHYLVEKYFSTPRWGVNLTFRDFSIVPLVGIARHMGRTLPDGMKVTGTLEGALGYSGGSSPDLEGQATLKNASLVMPGSKPVVVENAELLITHGLAQWKPTRAKFANGDEADFSGTYMVGAIAPEFVVSTAGLNVQALSGVPMLSDLKSGRWSGRLNYAQESWSGTFTLNAVDWAFDGFAEPVRIDSADGRLDGARVSLQRVRAHLGAINAQGEYRYEPGTVRPHRFRLGLAILDAAELERLAMPALARRNSLFGFGKAPLPDWLKNIRADGSVEIRELHAGDTDLQNLRSRVLWDGGRLTLPNLKAEWADGQISARALMDITGKAPAYEVYSKWSDISWKDGKVDADTVIQTSGFGTALATHLHAMGTFTGHDVLDDYPTVTGRFDLVRSGKVPKFKVTELQLGNASETLTGRAELQDDGFLLVNVANGTRQMKVPMK